MILNSSYTSSLPDMEKVETKLDVPVGTEPRNKSPITVQQWINSLPLEQAINRREEEMSTEVEASDSEVENLTLGAEASLVCPSTSLPAFQITSCLGGSDAGSHCSSMESFLEARKPDPEEILIDLGFGGGSQQVDNIARIPSRFLQPSQLKGVDIDQFLKQQQDMADTLHSSFNGYRGLTGRSHERPSVIVGKIMERLREAEAGVRQSGQRRASTAHGNPIEQHSPKLATVARNLLHKLRVARVERSRGGSVLSADNRRWLDNQGDKSPEPSFRRIIIGRQSFTFSQDGSLIPAPTPISRGSCSEESKSVGLDDGESNRDGRRAQRSMSLDAGLSSKGQVSRRVSEPSTTSQQRQKELECEFKNIECLFAQLPESQLLSEISTLDKYINLPDVERDKLKLCLLERGLNVYEERLESLELGPSLSQVLSSQANKVSSILSSESPLLDTLTKQLTSLLRHQSNLLEELQVEKENFTVHQLT